jgi:xanthine dehydrogenase YagS FAD-binding subunit
MQLFQYHRPTSVKEALALFQKNEGAHYIAGATNLLDLMKKEIATPAHLIDINQLPLRDLSFTPEGLNIGALVSNSEVAAHPNMVSQYQLISQALYNGASPQLRNMATVGGNILQRTRCPYFYDPAFPCNKRVPGSGCGAKNGMNRSAAIFGASDLCVAVHPSDLCVALAALDAQVIVQSLQGERRIKLTDFHRLPGETPDIDTVLERGELITGVFVPARTERQVSHYLKIRDRASYAFALVSVAIALYLDENKVIQDARIAFGGVAHKPWRAYDAESFLKNKKLNEKIFKAAADFAVTLLPSNIMVLR